jgi:hypothetical protein
VQAPPLPSSKDQRSLRPLLVLLGGLTAAWLASFALIVIELA